MPNGKLISICIAPIAGGPMRYIEHALAMAGGGLQGDRYATGEGSYNKGELGHRQVTFINNLFLEGSGFTHAETRRNVAVEGVELMWLIGREFEIGRARFRGVKYCDPCNRPSKLAGKAESFQQAFFDRGGLVAEIIVGGFIRVNDDVILPPKGY